MALTHGMLTLTLLILHITVLTTVKGGDVCYPRLGCFSDDYPWSGTLQRPHSDLPWPPEKINTRFFLFTGDKPNSYQTISAYNFSTITRSKFQTSRNTSLIVHGMADRAENNWVSDMCWAILAADNVNCVGVDWRYGSGSVELYVQAANNARLVGAEIAYLIKRLQEELGYSPSNVHIIGHSLGAHAAGEAGRRLPGIRRITGLDPARPWFENTPKVVHLDASDADFVDVIHTDTSKLIGVGMIKPVGHYDFYPNGGNHMSGCPSKLSFLSNKNNALQILACNHFRSFHYFTFSVSHPDTFTSYPCESYEAFTAGSCFPCVRGGCPTMGYYADSAPYIASTNQRFYLNTGGDFNRFSSWRYKISVSLKGTAKLYGKIYVTLYGSGGGKEDYQLYRGYLVPGETHSSLVDSSVRLEAAHNVVFHWTPLFSLFTVQLGAERIDVQAGEDGTRFSFCSNGTIPGGREQRMDPCNPALISGGSDPE